MDCPLSGDDMETGGIQDLHAQQQQGMRSQPTLLRPEMLQNPSLGGMPAQQMMMPMMPVQQLPNTGWDRQLSTSSLGSEDLSLGGMPGQQMVSMMPVSQMPQNLGWDRQMSGSSVGSEVSFVWVPVQLDMQNQPMMGQGVMPSIQGQDRQDQQHMVSVASNSKHGQRSQLLQNAQFQQQMQPRQQQEQQHLPKLQETSMPDNGPMDSYQQLMLLQQQQEMLLEELQAQEKAHVRNKAKKSDGHNPPLQSQIDQIEQLQRKLLSQQQEQVLQNQSPVQQGQNQKFQSQQCMNQQSIPQMGPGSPQDQQGQPCMPMWQMGACDQESWQQIQTQGGMAMMMKVTPPWQASPDAHPSAHFDQGFGKGGLMDEMPNQKKLSKDQGGSRSQQQVWQPGAGNWSHDGSMPVMMSAGSGQGRDSMPYYTSSDDSCMDSSLLYSSLQHSAGTKQEVRPQSLSYQQQLQQLQQQIMQMESELIFNNGRGSGSLGMAGHPKQSDGSTRNPRGGNKQPSTRFGSGVDTDEQRLALRRAAVAAAAQPVWPPERRSKREKPNTKVSPHYSLPTGHGALAAADTMKAQLQALQLEEPSTIFIARRINKLGFASAELLRLYFQKYGPVKGVYVSHSRVKSLRTVGGLRPTDAQWRLRAAGLGFVVMQTSEATSQILAEGPRHMVNGVAVQVHTFSRRACASEDAERNDGDEDIPSNDEVEGGSSDNQESSPKFSQSLDDGVMSAFKQYSEEELLTAMPEQYED